MFTFLPSLGRRSLSPARLSGYSLHEDPRCSPRFRDMAEATRRFTDSVLGVSDKQFLRNLPLQIELRRDNTRFYLFSSFSARTSPAGGLI